MPGHNYWGCLKAAPRRRPTSFKAVDVQFKESIDQNDYSEHSALDALRLYVFVYNKALVKNIAKAFILNRYMVKLRHKAVIIVRL